MSSYLTSLLTTTSSKVRNFLPTNTDTDGDTPDDTHICRALRAYYIEKGRAFPHWLPPDPKAPPPATMQFPQQSINPAIGAGYGGMANGGATSSSKMGSLWDSQPAAGSGSRGAPPYRGGLAAGGYSSRGGATLGARDAYARSQPSLEPEPAARPLPSQRAGSYQNVSSGGSSTPPPGTASGTPQDRLKARLWGAARTASPSQTQTQGSGQGRQASGGGGAGGNYEDSFMPGGSYGGRAFGGERERGAEKPFMAATAPWASDETEFMGGGYGGGYDDGGGSGGRSGSSSRPSGGRGPGLPSGPRGMR